MNPRVLDRKLIGQRSSEPAHRNLLEKINKEPLLDLRINLGQRTGTAGIVKVAVLTHATNDSIQIRRLDR